MDWFLPWTPGGPAPALLLSCKTVATSIGMNLSGKFELLNVNCNGRRTERRYQCCAELRKNARRRGGEGGWLGVSVKEVVYFMSLGLHKKALVSCGDHGLLS